MSASTPFVADETGAVTVDWVVLTAALVGLGLAVMAVVSGGVEDLSKDVEDQLKGQIISSSFGGVSLDGVDFKSTFAAFNLTAWNRYSGDGQDLAQLQAYYDSSQTAFDAALASGDMAAAEIEMVALSMAHYGATSDLGTSLTGTPFEDNYNAWLDAGGEAVPLVYE